MKTFEVIFSFADVLKQPSWGWLTLRVKGRQLENDAALRLFPDALASQTDLVTAALELWQAAVRLGPHPVLLRERAMGIIW